MSEIDIEYDAVFSCVVDFVRFDMLLVDYIIRIVLIIGRKWPTY